MEKISERVKNRECVIEIFGLGYVGFPLAVRLATNGFRVMGIDVNHDRVSRLEKNELLDSEISLKDEFIKCRERNLTLSTESSKNDLPKVGIICVPTPIPSPEISSDVYVKNKKKVGVTANSHKVIHNLLNFVF